MPRVSGPTTITPPARPTVWVTAAVGSEAHESSSSQRERMSPIKEAWGAPTAAGAVGVGSPQLVAAAPNTSATASQPRRPRKPRVWLANARVRPVMRPPLGMVPDPRSRKRSVPPPSRYLVGSPAVARAVRRSAGGRWARAFLRVGRNAPACRSGQTGRTSDTPGSWR